MLGGFANIASESISSRPLASYSAYMSAVDVCTRAVIDMWYRILPGQLFAYGMHCLIRHSQRFS